ncbi:hypothetical protein P154DRAFT_534861 [Amniculicola lignicola CBS 123094]|uniref:Uncharacterized protein n=1 Tax=Amniculicola lignicola CBS 123094 TaxID=1392246 RepID=A0A6A5WE94_9PLEO|nr:hypothetical protein P154DRAFT_534861 [Amniculicola lignicola CBS 123094]
MSAPTSPTREVVFNRRNVTPSSTKNSNGDTVVGSQGDGKAARLIVTPASRLQHVDSATVALSLSTTSPKTTPTNFLDPVRIAAVPKAKIRTKNVAVPVFKDTTAEKPTVTAITVAESVVTETVATETITTGIRSHKRKHGVAYSVSDNPPTKKSMRYKNTEEGIPKEPAKPKHGKLGELHKKFKSRPVVKKLPQIDLEKREEDRLALTINDKPGVNHRQRVNGNHLDKINTGSSERQPGQIRYKRESDIRQRKAGVHDVNGIAGNRHRYCLNSVNRPLEDREIPKDKMVSAPDIQCHPDPDIDNATWYPIPKSEQSWVTMGYTQVPWGRIIESPKLYPNILVLEDHGVFRMTKMTADKLEELREASYRKEKATTRKKAAQKAAETKRRNMEDAEAAKAAAIALGLKASSGQTIGSSGKAQASERRAHKQAARVARSGSSNGPATPAHPLYLVARLRGVGKRAG